jgi:hypothetical protein
MVADNKTGIYFTPSIDHQNDHGFTVFVLQLFASQLNQFRRSLLSMLLYACGFKTIGAIAGQHSFVASGRTLQSLSTFHGFLFSISVWFNQQSILYRNIDSAISSLLFFCFVLNIGSSVFKAGQQQRH